jgi:hypothetical protein
VSFLCFSVNSISLYKSETAQIKATVVSKGISIEISKEIGSGVSQEWASKV